MLQLDAFYKVKEAMDDMIATLKQQHADEVKKDEMDTGPFAAGPELATALSEATEIRTPRKEKDAQDIADAKVAITITPDFMESAQKAGSRKKKKKGKKKQGAPLSEGSDEKEKTSQLWARAVEPTDAPT